MRLFRLLATAAALGALAGSALAQTATPVTIKDGSGASQPLCEYKPDGTNLAGCTVKWVWNGAAWVLEPTGAGTTAGAPRTVVAQDSSTVAGSSSLPAGTNNIGKTTPQDSGGVDATDPAAHAVRMVGPCTKQAPVNITASGIIYTSTAKMHVCVIFLQSTVAQAVTLVEGTGALCVTGIQAFASGSTTADATHGYQLFAGQALTVPAGTPHTQTQTTGDEVCALLGIGAGGTATGLLTGYVSYSDY